MESLKNNSGPVITLSGDEDELPEATPTPTPSQDYSVTYDVNEGIGGTAPEYFSYDARGALLKMALQNDSFCVQMVNELVRDPLLRSVKMWITNEFEFLFKCLVSSVTTYGVRPSVTQIKTKIDEFAEDERELYIKALDYVLALDIIDEQFFVERLESFIKFVHMEAGISAAAKANNSGNLALGLAINERWVNRVATISLQGQPDLELSSVFKFQNQTKDRLNKIKTGIDALDETLRGGLPRQNLVTVVAGSNAGKSLLAVSFGCSALRQGLNVLHINLEGAEDEPPFRYTSNLADVDFFKLEDNQLAPAETKRVLDVTEKYSKNLVMKNMVDTSVSVEEVRAYCTQVFKKFKFDMLVVDYGQLMTTTASTETGAYAKQGHIYAELARLSKLFNCVVLSPVQATREAMKKMREKIKKGEDAHVLSMDDASDSMGIPRVSGVLLTMSRTKKEEGLGRYRLSLEKQRRGRKGDVFPIQANYANSNLVSNETYPLDEVTGEVDSGGEVTFTDVPTMVKGKYNDCNTAEEAAHQIKCLDTDIARMRSRKNGPDAQGDEDLWIAKHVARIEQLRRSFAGLDIKKKAPKEERIQGA